MGQAHDEISCPAAFGGRASGWSVLAEVILFLRFLEEVERFYQRIDSTS